MIGDSPRGILVVEFGDLVISAGLECFLDWYRYSRILVRFKGHFKRHRRHFPLHTTKVWIHESLSMVLRLVQVEQSNNLSLVNSNHPRTSPRLDFRD